MLSIFSLVFPFYDGQTEAQNANDIPSRSYRERAARVRLDPMSPDVQPTDLYLVTYIIWS